MLLSIDTCFILSTWIYLDILLNIMYEIPERYGVIRLLLLILLSSVFLISGGSCYFSAQLVRLLITRLQ